MSRFLSAPLAATVLFAACSKPSDSQTPLLDQASTAAVATAAAPDILDPDTGVTVGAPEELAVSQSIPTSFRAIGTEPFWSAQINDLQITYATPDMPEGRTVRVTKARSGSSMIFSAVIDGIPLQLQVARKGCSDGMSDRTYPMAVTRRLGHETHEGCAR